MKANKKRAMAPDTWTSAQQRAFNQKLAREGLEVLRAEVQRTGSGIDVLRAVSWCATRGVAMPHWLAVEFMGRYRAVTHHRVSTWDEAFDRPLPKGAHLSARRKAFDNMLEVYWLVEKRRQRGEGIGKSLFLEVADELRLNATETETFYYRAKRFLGK